WPTLLRDLVQPIHPLWSYRHATACMPYYWMTAQSERATDSVFRSADDLAGWYRRWLQHGITTLSCKHVVRYLGKHVAEQGWGRCAGEARIDLRQRRDGACLKFWYGSNALKIYDKEAIALRIATTVKDPKPFQV